MQSKNEEHESTTPKHRKLLNIESAIIIALAVGAFNLSGYAHLEKYYFTLGIPIDRLNLATQKFSIYGGAGLTSALLALLTALLIVSTFTLILLILEKPEKASQTKHQDKPEWVQRTSKRSQEISLFLKFLIVITALTITLSITYYMTVTLPSRSGEKAALAEIKECEEKSLVYEQSRTYEGCQMAESDDMFYLTSKTNEKDNTLAYRNFQIPKSGFIKSEGTEHRIKGGQ